MRKINYPLIVSDFDGTLVRKDGTINERDKQAIAEYVAAGGKFAISTGRLPAGILSRARELGLKGFVCCCQGAIIIDIESEQVILSGTLSSEITVEICKKMEAMDLHIHVYDLWDFYCNKDDFGLKLYEKLVKTKAKLVLDKPISQFVQEHSLQAYKVLAMVEAENNEKVLTELAAENFFGCDVTKSDSFLVEVINKKYSKGTAVEFLANHFGFHIEKTVAVGDQRNDLPMIQKAGVGIAVRNADESLKQEANFICQYSNEEGAIADIIERFGFCKEN